MEQSKKEKLDRLMFNLEFRWVYLHQSYRRLIYTDVSDIEFDDLERKIITTTKRLTKLGKEYRKLMRESR